MYEFIYNVISVVQTVVLFRGKLSEGRKYVILFWGFSRSSRILNFSDEKWLKNYDKKRIFFLQFDFEKLKWKLESKNSNIFIQTAKDPPVLPSANWDYSHKQFLKLFMFEIYSPAFSKTVQMIFKSQQSLKIQCELGFLRHLLYINIKDFQQPSYLHVWCVKIFSWLDLVETV